MFFETFAASAAAPPAFVQWRGGVAARGIGTYLGIDEMQDVQILETLEVEEGARIVCCAVTSVCFAIRHHFACEMPNIHWES